MSGQDTADSSPSGAGNSSTAPFAAPAERALPATLAAGPGALGSMGSQPGKGSIRRVRGRSNEVFIQGWLRLCAVLSIITTFAIVALLLMESYGFFQNISPVEFFFGTRWVPLLQPQSFGVLPLVWGTLQVTIGAALIAIPLGLASAIYLSEYAST